MSQKILNVFIHIVRSTSGVGVNANSTSSTIMERLNKMYQQANIQFNLVGTDYLDIMTPAWEQSFRFSNKSDLNKIFAKNEKVNCINIYVVSKTNDNDIAGVAKGIISNSFAINVECIWESTLAHELGHCLGLFHTHHGTDPNDIGDSNDKGIPELVNGSNGSTAGDYIADTPADPNIWNGGNDYMGGNLRDANGDIYAPDPNNLMSYAASPTKFSAIQMAKNSSTDFNRAGS